MSVLARKRKTSPLEFFANAKRIRKNIILLLMRDFGLRPRIKAVDFYTKKMQEEDKNQFLALAEKYELSAAANKYPEWVISKMRDSLWECTRSLMNNIVGAYSIYATNIREAYERRMRMTCAIIDCENILHELTLATDIFDINCEKYMSYVDMIEKEIALLKGWRKSDNKRVKDLMKQFQDDLYGKPKKGSQKPKANEAKDEEKPFVSLNGKHSPKGVVIPVDDFESFKIPKTVTDLGRKQNYKDVLHEAESAHMLRSLYELTSDDDD